MICTYYNLAIIFCAWNFLVTSPQETRGYQEIFQEQSKIEAIECKICIKFSDKLTSLNSWQAQSTSLHLIMNNGVYKIDLFDGVKLKSCIIYDGKYFYIDSERWDYKATIFNQHKDKNIDIKLLPWTLVQHFFFPLPVYHERFFVTYSFEQFEKNSNIYELSVNNRIGPSKSPLTEYGDKILYFNTDNRIVASKYKYPDVAFEKGLFSKSNLFSAFNANEEWDSYALIDGIFLPGCYRLYDLETNELLIEAKIKDLQSIKLNKDVEININPPDTIKRIVEYEQVPEWRKILSDITEFVGIGK